MNQSAANIARASYDRCCQTPNFPVFYGDFLERCPEARPMFAGSDLNVQEKRLRHAIGLLLVFYGKSDAHPSPLSRLAMRHSRADLDVDPRLYDAFAESLIDTFRRHDPKFDPEVERAWREVIGPGMAYMKAAYDAPPDDAPDPGG